VMSIRDRFVLVDCGFIQGDIKPDTWCMLTVRMAVVTYEPQNFITALT